MSEFIDINLVEVDLSYKLPPVGDYLSSIESYEILRNDDASLKGIKFTFLLLSGIEEGIGMKINDLQDPNNEIGKKKMKMMALACGVPFSTQNIDIEQFLGQHCGIKIIHRPGKDKETMFANISKFFAIEIPNVPGV